MEHKSNIRPATGAGPEGFDQRLLDEAARLAASLGFQPVPVRRRRDGWTLGRQLVYLAMLAAGASPREAAERVGMTPQGAGKLLSRSDARAFASACAAAYRIGEPTRRALASARRDRARAAASRAKVSSSPGSRTFETRETSAEPSASPPARLDGRHGRPGPPSGAGGRSEGPL